jgi:hypothetical protein
VFGKLQAHLGGDLLPDPASTQLLQDIEGE